MAHIKSAFGANIFITSTGLVGYDMSAMGEQTKLSIDNLSISQTLNDSFDYAIRLSMGLLAGTP